MHNHLQILKKEYFHSRRLILAVFLFFMAAGFSFVATSDMHISSATSTANFRPGNIISDTVMANYNSMSVTDIQNFLNSKNKCDNRDYDQYLALSKAYPNINWHWEGEPYNGHFVCMAEEKFGDGEIIGKGMTAAEIIYDAAQENHINPQVLLVLLQKESSLITDKVPNSLDYRKATGYGCPDTAACNSAYYGFKNQIYRAAELFRYTLDNGSISYPEGRKVYVGYNPSSSCGGSQVLIENRATAALYRYTPYQPNTAALNAGYGTGDQCSAYGNRNFYLYFTDWFGSTQAIIDGEPVNLPDGVYALRSKLSSDRVLGISGTNVELAKIENDDAQRWEIKRDNSTGYYTLKNTDSKKVITARSNGRIDQGDNIIISSDKTNCNNQWKIYKTRDDSFIFESSCANGLVLDVYGGTSTVGTNIDLWITNNSTGQKWILIEAPILEDGLYTINSSLNTTQVLDIDYSSASNGAVVGSWSNHGGENQQWMVKYDYRLGTYEIVNLYTNKALDLTAGRTQNGTKIETWTRNNGCGQRWRLVKNTEGYYQILSACSEKYAIDLNGVAKNGAKVTLWSAHSGKNQLWQFDKFVQPVPDGEYFIVPRASSDLAIDAEKLASIDGANVAIWKKHGGENQKWQVTYDAITGSYILLNSASGRALDVESVNGTVGANIRVWQQKDSCSQIWQFYPVSDGYYRIVSSCNPQNSLDLYGGYTANNTNIQLWNRNNSIAQQWKFVETD